MALLESEYEFSYKIVLEIAKHADLDRKYTPESLYADLRRHDSSACLADVELALRDLHSSEVFKETTFKGKPAYQFKGFVGSINALHRFLVSYKAHRPLFYKGETF
jgi:hypothetical protein